MSRLLSTVPVVAVFGLVLLTALLAVHLPTFAIARRSGVASGLATCVLGGVLGFVPFGVVILLFREPADTLPGLVQFWLRLPGEFVGGALPFVVAGAAFGADVGASTTRE